jgi:F-type H+-transporting ATPase subunit alpha
VTELLKQPQYSPLPISLMSLSLFAVNAGFLDSVDVKNVLPFEAGLHAYMKANHSALLQKIETSKQIEKSDEGVIAEAITEFKKTVSF